MSQLVSWSTSCCRATLSCLWSMVRTSWRYLLVERPGYCVGVFCVGVLPWRSGAVLCLFPGSNGVVGPRVALKVLFSFVVVFSSGMLMAVLFCDIVTVVSFAKSGVAGNAGSYGRRQYNAALGAVSSAWFIFVFFISATTWLSMSLFVWFLSLHHLFCAAASCLRGVRWQRCNFKRSRFGWAALRCVCYSLSVPCPSGLRTSAAREYLRVWVCLFVCLSVCSRGCSCMYARRFLFFAGTFFGSVASATSGY